MSRREGILAVIEDQEKERVCRSRARCRKEDNVDGVEGNYFVTRGKLNCDIVTKVVVSAFLMLLPSALHLYLRTSPLEPYSGGNEDIDTFRDGKEEL